VKLQSPVDFSIIKLIAITGFENLKMKIFHMVGVNPLKKII